MYRGKRLHPSRLSAGSLRQLSPGQQNLPQVLGMVLRWSGLAKAVGQNPGTLVDH